MLSQLNFPKVISYFHFIQAKVLNYHHDWHIVVFVCHKHGRGNTFRTYGTPGIGQEFIGTAENPTATGKAVFDVFRNYTKRLLPFYDFFY